MEMRVGKLKNGKASEKDEVTGVMSNGWGEFVNDWICKLCNMVLESGVVPEDWRSSVIVPLYRDKGERAECKKYPI